MRSREELIRQAAEAEPKKDLDQHLVDCNNHKKDMVLLEVMLDIRSLLTKLK